MFDNLGVTTVFSKVMLFFFLGGAVWCCIGSPIVDLPMTCGQFATPITNIW